MVLDYFRRGGEWYQENSGSRKFLFWSRSRVFKSKISRHGVTFWNSWLIYLIFIYLRISCTLMSCCKQFLKLARIFAKWSLRLGFLRTVSRARILPFATPFRKTVTEPKFSKVLRISSVQFLHLFFSLIFFKHKKRVVLLSCTQTFSLSWK